MKKRIGFVLYLSTLLLLSSFANSLERPEVIPHKISEIKASQWYLEKYRSWKSYLEENPKDMEGWVECFKAAFYSNMPEVEKISFLQEFENEFPNSAQLKWAKSKLTGWTEEGESLMDAALADLPKNQFLPERLLSAELKGADRAYWSQKIAESEKIFPSLMSYSYNVLMSVSENGGLFVKGENTTIPLWILQDVHGVRKDVKILNVDLLNLPSYQNHVLEKYGVTINGNNLLEIPENNSEIQFFYALTMPKQQIEFMQDRLYIVGLTSLLSDETIDNYALLKENIEGKFMLDYLMVDFNGEPKTATGKTLETNYIVPFFLLKEYYDQLEDKENSDKWRNQIEVLANRSQLSGRINMLLAKQPVIRDFKIVDIDVKSQDKQLVKVKDNIYASEVEVTNEKYGFFLDYLRENNYQDLFETAKIDLEKYEYINRQFHVNYHNNYKKSKSNFAKYPTMDMTYEGAKLYCEWLTTQYNSQKNRKFNKVKFRLPSRKEWTMAALGYVNFQSWNFEDNIVRARPYGDEKPRLFEEYRIGDYENVDYPWYHSHWEKYRSKITNSHGCYLANVKTPEETVCPSGIKGDGYLITSPVGTYFTNDMGLYDVIGNVAEMVDEPGIAMGGSWNHPPKESTITSINKYENSDPSVGFRIFMEVIEE